MRTMIWMVALGGCGNEGGRAPAAATPDTSAPEACGGSSFPCTVDAVDPAVMERSWQLSEEVSTRFDAGESAGDIRPWLLDQADVVAFSGEDDDASLFFRVDGGTWAWVIGPGADRPTDGNSAPIANLPPPPITVQYGDEAKQALVLSPFAHEFRFYDDGNEVAPMLSAVPETTVTRRRDAEVTSRDFANWGDYAVVHLATHGDRLCTGEGDAKVCRTVIALGLQDDATYPADTTLMLSGKVKAYGYYLVNSLGRSPGMEDTVLFLSTCSGAAAPDGIEWFNNNGGHLLAWDAPIDSTGALLAATRFYEETLENGRTTVSAMDQLRSEGVTSRTWNRTVDGTTSVVHANLDFYGPSSMFLRETVELLDQGERMTDGARLTLIGEPGDGIDDALMLDVKAYGVEADDTDLVVGFELDGMPAEGSLILDRDGTEVEPFRWIASGRIDLGFDVEDLDVHTLVATMDRKPGKTTHTVDVAFGGPRLVIHSELLAYGSGIGGAQAIDGVARLEPMEGGGFVGSGNLEFTSYYPLVSAPPQSCTTSWTVAPGSFEVKELQVPGDSVDPGEVPTALTLLVDGPDAEVTFDCQSVPVPIRLPDGFWQGFFVAATYEQGLLVEGEGVVMPAGTPGTAPDVAATWQVRYSHSDADVTMEMVTDFTLYAE